MVGLATDNLVINTYIIRTEPKLLNQNQMVIFDSHDACRNQST